MRPLKHPIDGPRPICHCGRPATRKYRTNKDGSKTVTWRTVCAKHNSVGKKYRTGSQKRKVHKLDKSECQRCTFKPEHPGQMHIDHIDGDWYNNDLSNLQVLCANCHALKTYTNGDHLRPPYMPHAG